MKPYHIIRATGGFAGTAFFVNYFTGWFHPLLTPALILTHISTVVYFQVKKT